MKKLLLSISAMAVVVATSAQCTELFISEYVVGTGNNKAYELYNPTANDINLNGYELQRWSNGDTNPVNGGVTILAGIIPAYGTWVVANGQTEDIDLGGFISPKCDPELQALADQLDNPYPAPTFMNGNDALMLLNSGSLIDIFGKPGEDPGQAWTAPDGTYITDSQTMVRKPSITSGITQPPVTFMPLLQYDTLGVNNWSNLGIHACACDPTLSIADRNPLDVSVYPTLVGQEGFVTIKTSEVIRNVEVYDITGKIVKTSLSLSNKNSGMVNVSALSRGAYILNIYMENNVTYSTRFIKE
ncbi:T9SS type A sorting domain-containing protein [Cryomorpha ignava]|uniref:T9SS type A sorting domain-containing protein n=1 Tax=Cryomorpha ignava TaxID=101383 RepID=A0A7K3WK39_9FLAO|nr:T9SS type A sorting domain-containing protein [Cryomorpha ignava]NEN21996.1 T9SS type A sorting domain-containing protein [Cryomorpha ignava]